MKARDLIREHPEFPLCWNIAQDILDRYYDSAFDFINCLNFIIEIQECKISLVKEYSREYYGHYENKRITIFTLKSDEQVIRPYVILERLVHEWKHHYEKYYLGIDRKRHSKAFYKNVKEIVNLFVK